MREINRPLHAVILDTETTDVKAPKLIEAAYGYINDAGEIEESTRYEQRFNPGESSKWGAVGVHHIFDFELHDKPPSDSFKLPDDVEYVIGHNIDYDLNVLGLKGKVKAIDTLALAKKAFPNLDSHKQVSLYYYLNSESPESLIQARDVVARAHSAAADIQMCSHNLQAIIKWSEDYTELLNDVGANGADVFERLHLMSQAASYPLVLTFGKHKGERPWAVPSDYMRWYSKLDDADPRIVEAMFRKTREQTPEQLAVAELATTLFDQPKEASPFMRRMKMRA